MTDSKPPKETPKSASSLLDALLQRDKRATEPRPRQGPPASSRNRPQRKTFSFYTKVYDYDTREFAGHLADISAGGFKLDSPHPVTVGRDFRFEIELTGEVADKPSIAFRARSRWCKVDPLDPFVYNVGFELTEIAPSDREIYNRLMARYARESGNSNTDVRHSNKW